MIIRAENIENLLPDLKFGCIICDIINTEFNPHLWTEIETEIEHISKIDIALIKDIPQIESSRRAYKILGKEPSRYRLSAEALYRKIIHRKGIHQVNTVVDIINLSSIKSGYSIGGYDFDKIEGDISLRIGNETDIYEAIGRSFMNLSELPIFTDSIGAFGSPTSDSVRTMISLSTTKVLLIYMNFGFHNNFENDLQFAVERLKKYSKATNIKIEIC